MASKEPQTVDLKTVEPQQLMGLRDQLEVGQQQQQALSASSHRSPAAQQTLGLQGEMQNLSTSATALQSAAGQFGSSGRAIERLAYQEAGAFPSAAGLAGDYHLW